MNKIKKNVLLVIYGGIHYGGVSIILTNWIRHMDRSDISITLYAFGSIESEEVLGFYRELDVEVVLGNCEYLDKSKVIKDIIKIIKNKKIDVIHSNTGGLELTAICMLIGFLFRIPTRIAHSHNKAIGSATYDYKARLLQKINNTFSTEKLACSKDAGKHLFGSRNIDNVKIINNGIESEKYCFNIDTRNEIRSTLGVDEDSFLIGNIGRFEIQKNHDFLIDIFFEIKKKKDNSKLLLIGEGSLKDTIYKKVIEYNLESDVIFLGTTNVIYKYLQAMDVFVLTSISEGLGIVAIEAQAASLPTICSDTVPIEAKISDNINFISLSSSAEFWCNEIIKYSKRNIRENKVQEVKKAGYDISKSANELQQIYKTEMIL